jgi:hypothetical protein
MRRNDKGRRTDPSPFISNVLPSKSWRRRLLIFTVRGCLFVILGTCLGCSGDTLDVSPEVSQKSAFRARIARAIITPQELGWMGGYSHRNRPAEGVAADLWTRVVAFEDHLGNRRVLVNADVHIFSRRMHKEILENSKVRFGLEAQEVMLIATRNHSGPALPEGFDPYINWDLDEDEMRTIRDAADRIRDQILEAMDEALSSLWPAQLWFQRGTSNLGINRRVLLEDGNFDFGANPSGAADPDVPVLVIESPEGIPVAVLFPGPVDCERRRFDDFLWLGCPSGGRS